MCGDQIDTALRNIREQRGGHIAISYYEDDGDRGWDVTIHFGKDEDSDVWSGRARGAAEGASDALTAALDDAGWS